MKRQEPKPKCCDRCGHQGFQFRGGLWGCLECGLWHPSLEVLAEFMRECGYKVEKG